MRTSPANPLPNPPAPAWDDSLLKNPHAVADKRRRVREMFAAIAPSYDLNNRLHSFGLDQRWRRRAVRLAELKATDVVVDVACGTGDLTQHFGAALCEIVPMDPDPPPQVIGIDFTFPMLPLAVRKWRAHDIVQHTVEDPNSKPGSVGFVRYVNGDAQALPLPDASADVVSIAFGIRNVQDVSAALREFRRVLRPGGRLIVLEFSRPTNPLVRWGNDLYCAKIMPRTATWISGDRSGAYRYLPKSVQSFIDRSQMTQLIRDAGFDRVEQFPMTFGVCVCYRGFVRDSVTSG